MSDFFNFFVFSCDIWYEKEKTMKLRLILPTILLLTSCINEPMSSSFVEINDVSEIEENNYYLYIFDKYCPICKKVNSALDYLSFDVNSSLFKIDLENFKNSSDKDLINTYKDELSEISNINFFKYFYVPLIFKVDDGKVTKYVSSFKYDDNEIKETLLHFVV